MDAFRASRSGLESTRGRAGFTSITAWIRAGRGESTSDAVGQVQSLFHVVRDEQQVWRSRERMRSSSVRMRSRVSASSAPNGSSM